MGESKHDKFVRIAENRTNKIIDMIRLLGNCSNKVVYEYSDEDAKAIFNAIECELKNAKNKFQDNELKESKFKLR
ncbi:hypothetical protein [Hathewaya limosa]|uniref:Uncharacterized protein (DUF433 family) n=1 Tax=Hathewaya limosa TaxID=1536 RepID=A0ABU0JS71_HATLI|nr:hypothetical protein [Hathewaya limosa]MDQ0479910.1 uncharacterized protein (DUF433 family) [Hathewaya limosa]